ncbi:cysteine proteinase inhibitor 5-like [Salvia miltiorrhiza]|uniref:cysteine proteinase inhibitor 5-like n=1 Tax=Salvia miltiorrhiza TaxID=226208 RepID=UPI0025ABF5AD|nr:cysteine proteinase inhibitor 5-like [Salvia miltiorrhiza]
MALKSIHILLAFLSLLAVSAASRGPIVGGWHPISNPNAPEIVEIAKFAVAEHNKEKKASLIFVSVVKGESQVVAGTNYRLVISAKDGASAAPKTYTAVVWSKVAPKSLELTSFEQIKG